jgi:hypothetical protein
METWLKRIADYTKLHKTKWAATQTHRREYTLWALYLPTNLSDSDEPPHHKTC